MPPWRTSNAAKGFTDFQFARDSLAFFDQNQQVQAIGDIGRVKFVAAALYYREHVSDNAQAFNTNTFTNATGSTYTVAFIDPATRPIDRASHVTTKSIGAFGQATWAPDIMNDVVHLTGGLRWTKGSKHTRYWSTAMGLDASWSQVDPMVNLAVDLIRDVHVYPYRSNQLYGLIVP